MTLIDNFVTSVCNFVKDSRSEFRFLFEDEFESCNELGASEGTLFLGNDRNSNDHLDFSSSFVIKFRIRFFPPDIQSPIKRWGKESL